MKPIINHKNGIKTDNRVDNIEWASYTENINHALDSGLNNNYGEKHCNAKLSNSDVLEIIRLINVGNIPQNIIANKYRIATSTVSQIKHGSRRRRSITMELERMIQQNRHFL